MTLGQVERRRELLKQDQVRKCSFVLCPRRAVARIIETHPALEPEWWYVCDEHDDPEPER